MEFLILVYQEATRKGGFLVDADSVYLWYNNSNGGAIGKLSCQMQFLWGETMIRPIRLEPLNRGCVETIVYEAVTQDSNGNETPIDLSNKKLYLTAKTSPWDTDADDSDAVFKVLGTNSNNKVTFSLTSTQTYIDPTVLYYFDIVQTDSNGSNPTRLAFGTFNVIGGANNAQAGGVSDD